MVIPYHCSVSLEPLVAASVNVSAMACLDGFQGHFDMLYDDERNQAYAEAIRRAAERKAPNGGATALDIGSGSGLLGLLCWQTGRFHRVVLLEACPPLATAAKENIQRNGAASCCTVWEGHSNDVLHQTEGASNGSGSPQPFDLCVSELLDSVLIGEGVLDSLRHAWASPYFGPGTTLIPQSATVFGRLFWSPALFAQHRGSATWNLPEDMQACPGLHAAEHLHLQPFLQAVISFATSCLRAMLSPRLRPLVALAPPVATQIRPGLDGPRRRLHATGTLRLREETALVGLGCALFARYRPRAHFTRFVKRVFSRRWEVIKDQDAEELPEAYYKIEENHLKPCCLQVNDKKVFFCLRPNESLPKAAKLCASKLSMRCNTCKHRMPIYAQLIGIDGKHMCFSEELEIDDPNVRELRKMRDQIRSSNPADYQVVIIDEEFFEANPKEVGPFEHMHFVKEDVSAADLSDRLKKLKNYLNGSFENRFQKLVDDPYSLKVIQDALPQLVRPDHWRGVVSWAVDFVAKADGKSWQELPLHKKFEVMIYAMLTGRVGNRCKASNLVDFMEGAENSSALCAMMDDRSNPETYQVSRVADRLRENRVASLCTVTLMWGLDGAPYKSDLDIHTWVNGVELYYGVRTVGKCKLDFDANASTIEKNPAENISLNQTGTFTFCVNNFNNRDAADVPFKVIVRKSGQEVAEHTAIWPKSVSCRVMSQDARFSSHGGPRLVQGTSGPQLLVQFAYPFAQCPQMAAQPQQVRSAPQAAAPLLPFDADDWNQDAAATAGTLGHGRVVPGHEMSLAAPQSNFQASSVAS
eukprot:s40_g14.t1